VTDLEKVSAEVFDLYQRNRYEEALVVARGVAAEFPARSSYWTACLLAVQGKGHAPRCNPFVSASRASVVAISDARTRL